MSDIPRGPCEECGEEITLRADECNHCGHNPSQKQYYGPVFCIMLGGVLTIFILTAIVGIPLTLVGIIWLIWVAYKGESPKPVDEEYLEGHTA